MQLTAHPETSFNLKGFGRTDDSHNSSGLRNEQKRSRVCCSLQPVGGSPCSARAHNKRIDSCMETCYRRHVCSQIRLACYQQCHQKENTRFLFRKHLIPRANLEAWPTQKRLIKINWGGKKSLLQLFLNQLLLCFFSSCSEAKVIIKSIYKTQRSCMN